MLRLLVFLLLMSESFYSDKEQTTTTENYSSYLHFYTVVEDLNITAIFEEEEKNIYLYTVNYTHICN